MATHYKSTIAARELGDIFAKVGWVRRGIFAWGVDDPTRVAVQYKSEALGERRVVLCEPLGLLKWLREHVERPGAWRDLLAILDRKPERLAQVHQQTLFPAAELAPVVQRSMNPNEQ